MGTGFSIDTPVKVAQYGINSVISLVDDKLVEEMRQYYCKITDEKYEPITKFDDDYRARRITAYLDIVDRIVKKKFEVIKDSCFEIGSEITKYFEMLSDSSPLKALYDKMLASTDVTARKELQEQLRFEMKPGSIDVNIMTKLDRSNFDPKRKELPMEFSDALSALRGYAKSTLNSAIIISAVMIIVTYSLYSINGPTNDWRLIITVPFVIFVILRQIHLLNVDEKMSQLNDFIKDKQSVLAVIVYGIFTLILLYIVPAEIFTSNF